MRDGMTTCLLAAMLGATCLWGCQAAPPPAPADLAAAAPGDAFLLPDGRRVEVVEVDILPVVRNDYSRRYIFDTAGNPKLEELRRREKLDAVVEAGGDQFDRQVRLLDWTYKRIPRFGSPTCEAFGALEIVQAVDAGHTFFCAHYARLFVSAAASMGWVARPLALRTARETGGAPEHSITEIWSDQYAKWILFDPTYALYVEADGVPLSAWEVRQKWLYEDGAGLTFVLGADRRRYTPEDLPVFMATHPGFGDLRLAGTSLDKLAFMAYIPNTNLMDAGYDYAGMFITKDALCEGVAWHRRDNPADPAGEPYFPLNQAALALAAASDGLAVTADTFTPNFDRFEHRLDGGPWQTGVPELWSLHTGRNTLEAVAVNRFGERGRVSKVVLDVR
ncbi:MAG: transglutaminase domain-containing protein [Planctomycetes bacterium]|nr:transglutaminase domain-containing protein [Planctomycetota bacterium]